MSIEKDIKSKGFLISKEKVYVNLIFTGFRLYANSNQFFKTYGLTEPQYNFLRILRGSFPSKMEMKNIQSRMLQPYSNTTRLLAGMSVEKLVRTSLDSKDKRVRLCTITAKGLRLLEEIDTTLKEHCNTQIQLTEAEMTTLNHLVDKLRAAL
jgi:DNA-binding MarR family transcriptional regulator